MYAGAGADVCACVRLRVDACVLALVLSKARFLRAVRTERDRREPDSADTNGAIRTRRGHGCLP